MTEPDHRGAPEEERPGEGPVIRDKRRIDPETGQVRRTEADVSDTQQEHDPTEPTENADGMPSGEDDGAFAGGVGEALPGQDTTGEQSDDAEEHPDTALAAQRLEQLRGMQAEFVNYRNRVTREREQDRTRSTAAVVEGLLPVLDDIHSAREHGDLAEGSPFAAIAEKLEAALGRFGAERVGAVGDAFDPTVHEALMHVPAEQADLPEGASGMTIVQVMQPGFRIGEHVVRPARVAVAEAP